MELNEKEAFELIKTKLGNNSFAEPKGSDAGFPDFGITWNGIHVYIEHKQNWKAQMSGLSSWAYTGNTFTSNVQTEEAKKIIRLMQREPSLKDAANHLLNIAKTLLNRKIGIQLKSTTFSSKPSLMTQFNKEIEGKKVLGNIHSAAAGKLIKDIYIDKFKSNLQSGSKHICLMMFNNEIWILDSIGVTQKEISELAKIFKPKTTIFPRFNANNGYIQVRIGPRDNGRIDTRALINLANKSAISFKGLLVK